MSFRTCLFIMAGGALGTLARYLLSTWTLPISHNLPWGTIGINLSGSFLIGFFGTLTLAGGRFPVREDLRLLVMVGFCGGYTTFSSFSLQTLELLRRGAIWRAGVNVVASVVLCVGAVTVGHLLAARLNGSAPRIGQLAAEEEASFSPGSSDASSSWGEPG